MPAVTLTEYTDPGCPFAWSAEPARRKLMWRYGDAIAWQLRMVGLAATRQEYVDKGLTPEMLATGAAKLGAEHGMPMSTEVRDAVAATLPACRAVVAARVHEPERERPLLRALRLRHFGGAHLDDDATIDGAARDIGLEPSELRGWLADEAVEAALAEDMRLARHPSPEALAQDGKLASWAEGRRYTCPSYELERASDGRRLSAPGFQPFAVYEVLAANLLPDVTPRPAPRSAEEVLAWAGEPLATAEVAALMDLTLREAREQLGLVAEEQHLGQDGIWSLG